MDTATVIHQTLQKVDNAVLEVERMARSLQIRPEQVMLSDGSMAIVPLLLARSNLLLALTNLKEKN